MKFYGNGSQSHIETSFVFFEIYSNTSLQDSVFDINPLSETSQDRMQIFLAFLSTC